MLFSNHLQNQHPKLVVILFKYLGAGAGSTYSEVSVSMYAAMVISASEREFYKAEQQVLGTITFIQYSIARPKMFGKIN